MNRKRMFEVFSEEKQKQHERVARLQYGPDLVNESVQRWNGYSQAQKEAIGAEGNQVYSDLVDALEAEKSPQSAEVQAILVRWHNHLRYFYEPTLDVLRGLGEMYHSQPDFNTNFKRLHPELPAYLRDGIQQYVGDLEDAELRRMLDEDEGRQADG